MTARFRSVLNVAALLAAFGLAGCVGTTYGTGVTVGKQTIDDLTGLVALGGTEKPPIDYKPRGGVVVPPKEAALPAPGEPTAANVAGNWPRDPEELEKARLAALEENPNGNPEVLKYLPKTATKKARYPDVKDHEEPIYDAAAARERRKLHADIKKGVSYDEDGNMVRKSLAEPPVAYREPDPTAPTEFDPKKKRKWRWPWQSN